MQTYTPEDPPKQVQTTISFNIPICSVMSGGLSNSSLVSLGVPELEDDDECDDEELQDDAEDAEGHVLDGDHLRRLVLEEERPAALRDPDHIGEEGGLARFL